MFERKHWYMFKTAAITENIFWSRNAWFFENCIFQQKLWNFQIWKSIYSDWVRLCQLSQRFRTYLNALFQTCLLQFIMLHVIFPPKIVTLRKLKRRKILFCQVLITGELWISSDYIVKKLLTVMLKALISVLF